MRIFTSLRKPFMLAAVFVVILIWPASTFACSCPRVSRDQIISYARSGVGSRYVWGGDRWDPRNRAWAGADCSGFVAKALMVPKKVGYTTSLGHPYTTSSFYHNTNHWYAINRSHVKRGDFLVYRSGSTGHVVLYDRGDPWGQAVVYEAGGTGTGISHHTRYLGSHFKARRRHNLTETPVAKQPPAWPSTPKITIARLPSDESESNGFPSSWAGTTMLFNNIDANNDSFHITNVTGNSIDGTFDIYNRVNQIQPKLSINIDSLTGNFFSQSIRQLAWGKDLTNSTGVIRSSSNIMASAKTNNGYLYQAMPKPRMYSRQYLDTFLVSQDDLFITNTSNAEIRVKVELYKKNKVIYRKTITLKPREIKKWNWKANKRVRSLAVFALVKLTSNRSILVSRKTNSGIYQNSKPETYGSKDLYYTYFNPAKEVLYLANLSPTQRASAIVSFYDDNKTIYKVTKVVERLNVAKINVSKTSAAKHGGLSVRVATAYGKLIGSKRHVQGRTVDALSRSHVTSKVYLQRFNPPWEKVLISNPSTKPVILDADFYYNGYLIHSYSRYVNARNFSMLDFNYYPLSRYLTVFGVFKVQAVN